MSNPLISADTKVGELAAHIPEAAQLFRDNGISFCCGGKLSLGEAAQKHAKSIDALLASLNAGAHQAAKDAPDKTEELIAHIKSRYHDTHRAELAELVPLAEKVESVHHDHADIPPGLSKLLGQMQSEMTAHMAKEEQILFPMMLSGGHPMIAGPIGVMRHDHEGHMDQLKGLEHLTNSFALPADACKSWTRLYTDTSKFAADLVRHMYLENEILFPRFDNA